MSVKKVDCEVVSVHFEWGVNEETFFPLRDIFDSSSADFWEFLNPGTLIAYFVVNRTSSHRAEQLMSNLDMLVRSDPRFSEMGISKSIGPFIAEFDWRGHMKSMPIGIGINEAIKTAMGRTSNAKQKVANGKSSST